MSSEERLIQNSFLIYEKYFSGVQLESPEYLILRTVANAFDHGTEAEKVSF